MKKQLVVRRKELNKFFNIYLRGRKHTNAPEGYIDYYEARSYLLETIEALEKKHADEVE